MKKTIIVADSACDISLAAEEKLPIKIMDIDITVSGKSYKDRREVTAEDIYKHLEEGLLPATSQVVLEEYIQQFYALAEEGYTDIIVVTLNGSGSGTYNSCHVARREFHDRHPDYSAVNIYIVDSETYSLGMGYPILKNIPLLNNTPPQQITENLKNHYQNQVTVIGLYSLKAARRSGRLNATAALVGDMLGIKPIMTIAGANKVVGKVRGAKALTQRMAEMYMQNAADPNGEYFIAYGSDIEKAHRLTEDIVALGGSKPIGIAPIGSCIAINAGPDMVGMVYTVKQDVAAEARR